MNRPSGFELSEREKEAVTCLKKQCGEIKEILIKYLLSKSKKSENIQEAITYAYLAVAASKYLKDEWRYALSAFELASLYLAIEERKKALLLFEDIYNIFKDHSDPYYEAALSGNLGTIYLDDGYPEKALACFRDALTIYCLKKKENWKS